MSTSVLPRETLNRISSIIRIFAIIILFGALGSHAYSYYIFLRWVVCAASVFWAYQSHKLGGDDWAVAFSIVALLFNPFIPVHLSREWWAIIDLGAAAIIGASNPQLKCSEEPTFNISYKYRGISSAILSISLLVGVYISQGFADIWEFFFFAFVCSIGGGVIIVLLEEFGYIHKEQDESGYKDMNEEYEETEEEKKRYSGIDYYLDGKQHLEAKNYEKAIDSFNKAIEIGQFKSDFSDVYGFRGSCYQACNLHDKAIDDYSMAISLHPEDCNLYFQRAMSKSPQFDLDGAIIDIQEAIRLSRIDSELNVAYYLKAQDMGNPCGHTQVYTGALGWLDQMKEILPILKDRKKNK